MFGSRVKDLKSIGNDFSNILSSISNRINEQCNDLQYITFTYNDLNKSFGNTIVNEYEGINVSDLLKILAQKVLATSQDTINKMTHKLMTNDFKGFFNSDPLTNMLNECNNDLQKIINLLYKNILSKIENINLEEFNNFKQLLGPVVSAFYKLTSKVKITILHNESA